MQSKATPIAYPTTAEEEHKWGFDIVKPHGQPMAFIHDWPSAKEGFSISPERASEVATYNVDVDLSKLTVGELFAAHALMFKLQFNTFYKLVEDEYGLDKALDLVRKHGHKLGIRGWNSIKAMFGLPVPVDKVA